MATQATPRWRIKFGVGVAFGLFLSGYGFISENPYFMWGILYIPILLLTPIHFWNFLWYKFCKICKTGIGKLISQKLPSINLSPKQLWQKKLLVGGTIGLLLGIAGIFTDNSYLIWGFLYVPLLSLTNKKFWKSIIDGMQSDSARLNNSIQELNETIKKYGLASKPVKVKEVINTVSLQKKTNSSEGNIKSMFPANWLKRLRIGVITGILLGIIGFMAGASWLTWGLLYAPLLSLTNKAFWAKAWEALGAKDESGNSSPDESEEDSLFSVRDEEKGNHHHSHYHGHY